jgi:hypothetical protein
MYLLYCMCTNFLQEKVVYFEGGIYEKNINFINFNYLYNWM